MAKYTVNLRAPKGHTVPALLSEFGKWLRKQPYGSVGWFELVASAVPGPFGDADPRQLQNDAWCFVSLPDGSLLALIDAVKPAPVVLFGSDGEAKKVSPSLEAFLLALSRGKTRVDELDEEEDSRRAELAEWLKSQKVRAPAAAKFTLRSYLSSIKLKPKTDPAAIKKFPPEARDLVALLGRSLDDPEVEAELRKLKFKVPRTKKATVLSAKKRGLEVHLANVKKLNARSLTVTEVCFTDDYKKALPYKLNLGFNKFTLKKTLGKPTGKTKDGGPVWEKPVDKAAGVYFHVSKGHWDPSAKLRIYVKTK